MSREISLAIIARNAGDTLGPCLDSIKDYLDEIVVVLGGKSTDDTEAVARRYTDKVFPFRWRDDFAAARNASFKQCTKPWIFWIDADDVVENPAALPELVKEAEEKNWGAVHLRYDYQFDEHGNCLTRHATARLLRADLAWEWHDRLHETARTEMPHSIGGSDKVWVRHTRMGGEHLDRNNRLLRLMLKEDPDGTRTWLAYAHNLFGLGRYEDALDWYTRYHLQPQGDLEAWHAAVFAAKCCWQLARWQDMANWAMIAVNAFPELKDGYYLMAQAEWWGRQDATRTLTWIENGGSKLDAPLAVFVNPQDYTLNVWDVQHRAYASLGMWQEALATVENAMKLLRQDAAGWSPYYYFYSEAWRAEGSVEAAAHLVDHLVRRQDTLKAYDLLMRYLPHSIETDERVHELRKKVGGMVRHLHDDAEYDRLHDEEHLGDKDQPNWNDETLIAMPRVQFAERRVRELRAKRILEVGCAGGGLGLRLAKLYGCEVVGVDLSPSAIKRARERAEAEGLADRVTFIQARMEDVANVGQFDLAIAFEILEHQSGPQAQHFLGCIEELAPHVLLSCPAQICGSDAGLEDTTMIRRHVREFNMRELAEILGIRRDRRIINLYRVEDKQMSNFIPGWGSWLAEWELHRTEAVRIVIYCGPGLEAWSPLQIDEKGLGGSETGAVKLAESFVQMGFDVAVYGEFEGVVNGVHYAKASQFDPGAPYLGSLPAWLMIGSRIPVAAAMVNAQNRILWMHDVDCADALTPELADRLTRVIVLSDWHRGHVQSRYPWLDAEKLLVIGDGIEQVTEALRPPKRHSFVYASSPDRGLHLLLDWWPAIRQMWPDATLDVYYGWANYDAMMQRFPQMRPFKQSVAQQLAALKGHGVTEHGRVGQAELRDAFSRTQFWLYPSMQADGHDWYETFCITALEAQAGGCIPIVHAVGALPERCTFEDSLVQGINENDYLQRLQLWAKMRPEMRAERRRLMSQAARKQTWKAVAQQWLDALLEEEKTRLMSEADEREVPQYE